MKRVYTCFCTDVIHEGHLNIIHEARKYGEVVVGVLSDAAMIRFNRFPTVSFEERVQLVKDIPDGSRMLLSKVFPGFLDTLFSAACCWHFYKH